ncbi:MAG: hypothetical protein ACE5Z5_12355 [Candidatus Bathyarchaeia archaeon]
MKLIGHGKHLHFHSQDTPASRFTPKKEPDPASDLDELKMTGVITATILKPEAVPAIASTLGPLAGAAVDWYLREKAGS